MYDIIFENKYFLGLFFYNFLLAIVSVHLNAFFNENIILSLDDPAKK